MQVLTANVKLFQHLFRNLIGAGSGYYTAILAQLAGLGGQVSAYEIQPGLAERAARCVADLPNVTVYQRSGAEALSPTAMQSMSAQGLPPRCKIGSMPYVQADDCSFHSLLMESEIETCWCSGNGWWLPTSENGRKTTLVS
jgi:16S rRNA A1518/A1519 N6-dimethyltransferase RsmA/KsgA/DIM1 with predicted DNA glycosylase/AP lyase activity